VETIEAEIAVLLETAQTLITRADGAPAWVTPTYDDARVSSGTKAYARVIVAAASEQPSLIEAAAEAIESQEVKLFAPRIIRSRSGRHGGRFRPQPPPRINRFRTSGSDMFHTAKRYRAADAGVARPRWNRHDPHSPRHHAFQRLSGMALRGAEHAAYDRLEQYCSTRLPESFGKFCRPVLRRFRRISEGLSYGDRVPHVCMQVSLCKGTSYVVASPHDRLEERTF